MPMLIVMRIALPIFTIFTSSRMEKRSSSIIPIPFWFITRRYLSFSSFLIRPPIDETYFVIRRSVRASSMDLRISSTLSTASS